MRRPTALLINAVLLSAVVLLVVGVFAPLLTLKQLLIFSDTVSLASALALLLEEGYLALFAVVLTFSVLFPAAKLAALVYFWNVAAYHSPSVDRVFQWLLRLGKWSMLDVFVVALLVVSIKLQLLADAEVRFGLYAFGGSVLLTSAAGGVVSRRARDHASGLRAGA